MSSRSRYSLRVSASGLKRQRSLIQSTSSLAGLAWQCLSSGTLVVTRVALPVPETTSSGPAPAPKGILYSCSGEFFITEALHSARSSLRHNPLPHVLFASGEVDATDGVSIVRFQPSANPWADKIANMRRSPFERTIYLDTDTFVVDEIAHVLRLLDHYDLAVAYAPYRALEDPEVPRAFYEFNTGVLAWRASDHMAAFLRSWEETYLAWLSEEPFAGAQQASRWYAEQPAFRHCAWEHGVRLFVLPHEYNFRFEYPMMVRQRVRVIHGRHDDYEALAASINREQRMRVWPRPQASIPARVRRRARRAVGRIRRALGFLAATC